MAKAKTSARSKKAPAPLRYSIIDANMGGGRDSCFWSDTFRTCKAALDEYLRFRGEVMRTALDDVGKVSKEWQLGEIGIILRGNEVAAGIRSETVDGAVWASIRNFETGQIIKQVIEIPATMPEKKSA